MLKSIATILNAAVKPRLLRVETCVNQPSRSTFILKRRNPVPLHKKGHATKRLKARHYIYDLEKDTCHDKQSHVEVILTTYVDAFGNKGDRLTLSPNKAYEQLLLPGLAVYATPENIDKFKDFKLEATDIQHSSPESSRTVTALSRMILSVTMNSETPWTLKPWHIKTAFRKYGYNVPDECIECPEQPIRGPDMDIENKEFFVIVTINKLEKVKVCCRVHHWDRSLLDTVTKLEEFWKTRSQPIFAEEGKPETVK